MSSKDLRTRALDFITRQGLVCAGDHVLVAVSGGPDSVALLHLLYSLKQELELSRLTVLHFDHRLRGQASAEDRSFVQALAGSLELPFRLGQKDVAAFQREQGMSLEMAARACRHQFFRDVLVQTDAHRIALGHTADDQAEELLLRLLRGTGPAGMAGMRPVTPQHIVRPLLFARRADIIDYIHRAGLRFRQDASNLEPFCQRNLLRIEVFPILTRHFHPALSEVLARHAGLARDEEDYWAEQVRAVWPKLCLQKTPTRVTLHPQELLSLHPALQRRVLRLAVERIKGDLLGFYAVHFQSMQQWITQAACGKALQLPHDIWAAREKHALVISRGSPFLFQAFRRTVHEPGRYDFDRFELSLYLQPSPPLEPRRAAPTVALMDADKIQWPLIVRSWQPGDRFRPLGLGGTKKLQDYFVDAGIPRSRRGRIPLLCDRTGICWVMGLRLDERVRITPRTVRALIAEFDDKDGGVSAPEEAL